MKPMLRYISFATLLLLSIAFVLISPLPIVELVDHLFVMEDGGKEILFVVLLVYTSLKASVAIYSDGSFSALIKWAKGGNYETDA